MGRRSPRDLDMNHLAIGMPGLPELLIIGGLLLLLFGGRKLPELARAMGKSITQFKEGLKDTEALLDKDAEGEAGRLEASSATPPEASKMEGVATKSDEAR